MRGVTVGSLIPLLISACCMIAGCTAPGPAAGPGNPAETAVTGQPTPETTVPATPPATSLAATTLAAATVSRQSPTVTVTAKTSPTIALVPEVRLNALIRDGKNKLDALKQSDKADTVIQPAGSGSTYCEITKSRELGYLIDATDGNVSFFKGDYGSISGELILPLMNRSHAYVFLHTHPKNVAKCSNGTYLITSYSLSTFSLSDLAFAGALTEDGYHILKLYAIADSEYEIYPNTAYGWKPPAEIEQAVLDIEDDLEVRFNNDVDNLMPLLAKELGYRYLVNNHVMTY